MFSWADEFLGDDTEAASSSVAVDTSNLATDANQPGIFLTSQSYPLGTSETPQRTVTSTSNLQSSVLDPAKSGVVVMGGQQLINTAQTGYITYSLLISEEICE